MAFPKDLEGQILNFKIPGGTGPRQMLDGLVTGQTTMERVVVRPTVLDRTASAFPGRPWNFTFLKYYPGWVTVCAASGAVLTGPMTGCYIFKYTKAGSNMVAHVGTANIETSEQSVNAKLAWSKFANDPAVTNIGGGNPKDYFTDAEFAAAVPRGTTVQPQICCYIDGTGLYSLLLSPEPAGADRLRVAAVKPMVTQPWSTIGAMRTFKLTADDIDDSKIKDRTAFRLS